MIQDFFYGMLLGFTGLIPFFHTNLVLQFIDGLGKGFVLVAALAFSHAVFEAVPSTIFFIPTPDYSVSILPAHKLAAQGRALEVINAVLFSLFASILFSVLLLPVLSVVLPTIFSIIKPFTGLVLIALCVIVLRQEHASNSLKKFALVFALSGLLGKTVFDSGLENPLFPLLTGLFGLPLVIESLSFSSSKPKEVEQNNFPKISFKLIFLGTVLGAFSGLLPALSPSVLACVALLFFSIDSLGLLALCSAISCSKLFYDFYYATAIYKARSAAAAVFLGKQVSQTDFLAFSITCLAAVSVACLILFSFGKKIVSLANSINQKLLSALMFFVLLIGVYVFCGPVGLFACAASVLVGLLATELGAKKSACTGALILPTILYFV